MTTTKIKPPNGHRLLAAGAKWCEGDLYSCFADPDWWTFIQPSHLGLPFPADICFGARKMYTPEGIPAGWRVLEADEPVDDAVAELWDARAQRSLTNITLADLRIYRHSGETLESIVTIVPIEEEAGAVPESQYRLLADGEVIREGDQVFYPGDGWSASRASGLAVPRRYRSGRYRRPIRTEGAPTGYRFADWGEELPDTAQLYDIGSKRTAAVTLGLGPEGLRAWSSDPVRKSAFDGDARYLQVVVPINHCVAEHVEEVSAPERLQHRYHDVIERLEEVAEQLRAARKYTLPAWVTEPKPRTRLERVALGLEPDPYLPPGVRGRDEMCTVNCSRSVGRSPGYVHPRTAARLAACVSLDYGYVNDPDDVGADAPGAIGYLTRGTKP